MEFEPSTYRDHWLPLLTVPFGSPWLPLVIAKYLSNILLPCWLLIPFWGRVNTHGTIVAGWTCTNAGCFCVTYRYCRVLSIICMAFKNRNCNLHSQAWIQNIIFLLNLAASHSLEFYVELQDISASLYQS
jgi:hypothetical protein